MNSYLYDDDIQIEETPEFRSYETEMEYWEEYDTIKAGSLSENHGYDFFY